MRLLAAAAVGALCFATATATAATPLKVVARNLDNPRKLVVAPGGALYVVEAGSGGRDRCLKAGPSRFCVGSSGTVARLLPGPPRTVVSGLWSGANPDGSRAQGPADVLVRGGTYDVLLQDGPIDAHGFNDLGPDATTAGDLVSTPGGRVQPSVIFNFAAFEAARNPDHGAGPGARFGDRPVDSDPYAVAAYRGGYAVVDAAGNDLLWVRPNGKVSVLAVFPVRRVRLTQAEAKKLGVPGTRTMAMQSVPSSVAVGPDGALYVGELTGLPYPPGSARVWRVVPGRPPAVYASGFTAISDLAFAGRNLLVLEIASKGLLHPGSPGALMRVSPGGERTVLASAGLVSPTGVAVGNGSIYVSNYGTSPARGAGRHGEVVSLPASLAG